jgi:nucleotide-binding universal stress UspA family protein
MQIQRIVFPVDFSERCRAVAPFVQSMARRYGAMVTLTHAIPPLPPLYYDFGAVYPDATDVGPLSENVESLLQGFAAEHFPHLETRCMVLYGEPGPVVVDFAKEIDADLIALPTHGYGLFRRALLGSVTAKILHDSEIPVWTSAHACEATHRAHPQPRMIVAAVDLKEPTNRTLQTALALAKDAGAAVEILHIASEGGSSAAVVEDQTELAVARAATAGSVEVERRPASDTQMFTRGERVASVVRRLAISKRADLVVIGRGSIHGHLLDRLHSHAYSVICDSPCPVLSI